MLCICLLPTPTLAAVPEDYKVLCGGWTFEANLTVQDPQTAVAGQLLTGWGQVERGADCIGWTEDFDNPLAPGITRLYADQVTLRLPIGAALAGMTVMDGGQAHTVYTFRDADTGNDVAGMGYILKARTFSQNTGGAWSALNLVPGVDHTGIGYDWSYAYAPAVPETPWEPFEMEYQVALVKTGEVWTWPTFIYVEILEDSLRVRLDTTDPGLAIPPEESGMVMAMFLNLPPPPDCEDGDDCGGGGGGGELPPPPPPPNCGPRTPGINYVALQAAFLSDFDAVGSTAKERYFSLYWDCISEGLEFMEYRFLISSGKPSPDAAQGVLPQERPAGAQGVGIQVLEDRNNSAPVFIPSGNYQPIEFDVLKAIRPISLDPGAPGYELRLMARYYQTEPDMTAGSVEGGVTIVLTIY